jgi:hypothetical protein
MKARDIVGELRPSQILFTYGVGATVELPQLSTLVLGLDDWPKDRGALVSEPRLLNAVRHRLGHQVTELRTPPRQDENSLVPDGVPVAPFPQWLRCPVCQLLAPVTSGLFDLLQDRYRPERTRYVHKCTTRGLPPTAYPARFLLACRAGHLDDFPWSEFVHRGIGCKATLRLKEIGMGGGPVDVQVECDGCPAKRRLGDAFGQRAGENLPTRCRGRHPHIGTTESCEEAVRTILLAASNSWFPVSLSALSIPTGEGLLDQRVEARWAILEKVTNREVLQFALDTNEQLAGLREHALDEILYAIERRRNGDATPGPVDLRGPEWAVLSQPDSAPETDDFRLRTVAAPSGFAGVLDDVVLGERLREVVALTGFTRVEAPDDLDENGPVEPARISREPPEWTPCTEVRGEGVFLRFRTPALEKWESRYLSADRAKRLWQAHHSWRARRRLPTDGEQGWPGLRYVLLHSLSHALMRELALECGYGASSIRERIYSGRPDAPDMAGLLLYTAAPDSEGTLGGLVGLGEPDHLGRLLSQALERARVCSADPLCSEHDPTTDGSVHHAACHACQFASETSCERGNRFLDRAVLVDTFTTAGVAFFQAQ